MSHNIISIHCGFRFIQKSYWLLVALLAFPHLVSAGGTGYAGAGAKGLGRAGAFAVKADDTSALLYNPANLAAIPGIQLGGGTHISFSRSCFNRAGTYGDPALYEGADIATETTGAYASIFGGGDNEEIMSTQFPEVCNSAAPQLVPDLGFTWRVHPMVGIGLGLVAPPGVATLQFGDKAYGKRGIVATPATDLPAPTRFMLVDMKQLEAFPSLAIGVSPIPLIRFGLTAGWGFVTAEQTVMAHPLQGEWFATDSLVQMEVKDIFVPRLTGAFQVNAVPNILETMVYFTWQADIEAEGSIKYTSGYYSVDERGYFDKVKAKDVTMTLPQPWQAGLGIRGIIPRGLDEAALKAREEEKRPTDGMATEIADIELDVVYEINNRVDAAVIKQEEVYAQGFAEPGELMLRQTTIQNFVWKDQVSVRLGSDINVVPDILALRLGFHYETHGVVKGWEQLNFMPFQRIGIHAGLTVRVWRLDFNLGYGFIYQFPVTLKGDEAKQIQIVSDVERGEGTIVNAGDFTSSYHIIGVGLTSRFI